jgi:hypothetical protein
MTARRRLNRRSIATVTTVAVVLALLVWATFSALLPGRAENGNASGRVLSAPRPPANVPLALLADYYEHAIEHTPPRDPSGSMQRRERNYTAPPHPLKLVRSRLSGSPGDRALRRDLDVWEKAFQQGAGDVSSYLDALERGAADSSLDAVTLLDVGRGMHFLAGNRAAAAWYRAGLEKAGREYAGRPPGDASAKPLLDLLDQTKSLWRLNDHAAMEKRFSLAMRLQPPLSPEARRAACLYSQMLFYQNRHGEASDVTLELWKRHEQAGDLGKLEKSDFGEMHWLTGLFLTMARRHAEAVPHWEGLLRTTDPRQQQAARYLVTCLVESGKYDEAKKRQAELAPPVRVGRGRVAAAGEPDRGGAGPKAASSFRRLIPVPRAEVPNAR